MSFARQRAARLQLFEDGGVIGWRRNHGDVLIVLRGGADHGGAADIDVFDQLFERGAGLRGDVFEAVEIDDHHVDGGDAVFGECAHVVGLFAHGENSGGDVRVNGLDAAIHHFGEAGDVGDVSNRDSRLAKQTRGAAGGDELSALRDEAAGEIG